jgi:hypothetical protein
MAGVRLFKKNNWRGVERRDEEERRAEEDGHKVHHRISSLFNEWRFCTER